MFLALTTLTTRLAGLRDSRRQEPRKAEAPLAVRTPIASPARCFEVLVPYYDARESERRSLPSDTRHTLVVNVWAPDVARAVNCARERFHDHRRTHDRAARMAAEGPIALRIAREVEEKCALR